MARRRARGSMEDLLPDDRVLWARDVWRDRAEIAAMESGAWMLREVARILKIDEAEVDRLLKP